MEDRVWRVLEARAWRVLEARAWRVLEAQLSRHGNLQEVGYTQKQPWKISFYF